MKQIIRNVISNSNLTEPYVGLPELSCCLESAEDYDNYYRYIELNSDEKILDLIEESNILFEYSKLFLTYGVYSRIYFKDKYKMINIFNNFDVSQSNFIALGLNTISYLFNGSSFSCLTRSTTC
mgnify:CR=1 FL=1